MEEVTSSTKTLKIVLIAIASILIVLGILGAVISQPSEDGECAPVNQEEAPF